MKNKTLKELWHYCYSSARQINTFLREAKSALEHGNIDVAMWNAMEAGELVNRLEIGYSPAGSVYIYKLSDTIQFDVYTADGNRFELCFSYGDNTPRNRKADTNRREWQKQARLVERVQEKHDAHCMIAWWLTHMTDEDFFKAYDAIERIAEASN